MQLMCVHSPFCHAAPHPNIHTQTMQVRMKVIYNPFHNIPGIYNVHCLMTLNLQAQ